MKNIFLFIILGLITIGCEEAHTIMSSAGGSDDCEYWQDCDDGDDWICAETYEDEPWWVYDTEESCLQYCESECIIKEE